MNKVDVFKKKLNYIKNEYQRFVDICDFLASKKFINIVFLYGVVVG